MISAHSKIGASSMHRWAACPGSVRLSANIENKTSEYAEEGTLAHDIAAKILVDPGEKVVATDDMWENVKVYTEYVQEVVRKAGPGAMLLVEKKFDLTKIYPGLFGTADAVVFEPMSKILHVIDLKYGQGIPVEVVEAGEANVQLMYYGLGALIETGFPASAVKLTIVQPRCPHSDGPIRSHTVNALDLLDFAADLVMYAKKTEDPNAPLNPGDHCRFCPAAGTCPAIHNKALAVATQEFSPAFSYDPEKLAKTLAWIPVLQAWCKSVTEFAYTEAMQGRTPPGHKLVAKRATRKWRDETCANEFLQNNFKLSYEAIHETPSLKSPAQIEKLLTKNDKGRLNEIVEAISSGSTLVPDTDKRQEISAKTEFTPITD